MSSRKDHFDTPHRTTNPLRRDRPNLDDYDDDRASTAANFREPNTATPRHSIRRARREEETRLRRQRESNTHDFINFDPTTATVDHRGDTIVSRGDRPCGRTRSAERGGRPGPSDPKGKGQTRNSQSPTRANTSRRTRGNASPERDGGPGPSDHKTKGQTRTSQSPSRANTQPSHGLRPHRSGHEHGNAEVGRANPRQSSKSECKPEHKNEEKRPAEAIVPRVRPESPPGQDDLELIPEMEAQERRETFEAEWERERRAQRRR
jgi:hypothetical protein